MSPQQNRDSLQLKLYWPYPDGLSQVLAQIRRLLDLDADLLTIEQQLIPLFGSQFSSGIRIPGLWSSWEAAVRAVLGQQVSIAGARSQLNRLVTALGTTMPDTEPQLRLFPTPQQVLASDLQTLKVPQARRDTLQALAAAVLTHPAADPTDWLAIKGIGPWTVAYSKMRGLADPDIWLAGDLGVQKALKLQSADFAPATSRLLAQLCHLTVVVQFTAETAQDSESSTANNRQQARGKHVMNTATTAQQQLYFARQVADSPELRQHLDTPLGLLQIVACNAGIRQLQFVAPSPAPAQQLAKQQAFGTLLNTTTELWSAQTADAGAAQPKLPLGAEQHLRAAVQQLQQYFAGQRQHFQLTLAPTGTDFQHRVWQLLAQIP